jgi:predicted transcriptional regulator
MSRKRSSSPRHVSVRLGPEVVARIDALADIMTPNGSDPSRSLVLRAAILAGLSQLEAQSRPKRPKADA